MSSSASEYTFTYPAGPKDVILTGNFDNWEGSLPMIKDSTTGAFHITVPVKVEGKFYFKFIVDGGWSVSDRYGRESDGNGFENNFITEQDITAVSGVPIPEAGGLLAQTRSRAPPSTSTRKKSKGKKSKNKKKAKKTKKNRASTSTLSLEDSSATGTDDYNSSREGTPLSAMPSSSRNVANDTVYMGGPATLISSNEVINTTKRTSYGFANTFGNSNFITGVHVADINNSRYKSGQTESTIGAGSGVALGSSTSNTLNKSLETSQPSSTSAKAEEAVKSVNGSTITNDNTAATTTSQKAYNTNINSPYGAINDDNYATSNDNFVDASTGLGTDVVYSTTSSGHTAGPATIADVGKPVNFTTESQSVNVPGDVHYSNEPTYENNNTVNSSNPADAPFAGNTTEKGDITALGQTDSVSNEIHNHKNDERVGATAAAAAVAAAASMTASKLSQGKASQSKDIASDAANEIGINKSSLNFHSVSEEEINKNDQIAHNRDISTDVNTNTNGILPSKTADQLVTAEVKDPTSGVHSVSSSGINTNSNVPSASDKNVNSTFGTTKDGEVDIEINSSSQIKNDPSISNTKDIIVESNYSKVPNSASPSDAQIKDSETISKTSNVPSEPVLPDLVTEEESYNNGSVKKEEILKNNPKKEKQFHILPVEQPLTKRNVASEPGPVIPNNANEIKEFSEIRDVDAKALNKRLNEEMKHKKEANAEKSYTSASADNSPDAKSAVQAHSKKEKVNTSNSKVTSKTVPTLDPKIKTSKSTLDPKVKGMAEETATNGKESMKDTIKGLLGEAGSNVKVVAKDANANVKKVAKEVKPKKKEGTAAVDEVKDGKETIGSTLKNVVLQGKSSPKPSAANVKVSTQATPSSVEKPKHVTSGASKARKAKKIIKTVEKKEKVGFWGKIKRIIKGRS